jgi:hypothetical protein
LLAFHIDLVEARVGKQVSEQIKRRWQTLVRNLYGEPSHLMGCKSVKVAPKPVRLNGDIASGAARGPFENCMFDEMADTVEFRSLVAGTAAHPDAGGNGPQAGHVLSQNSDAVGESGRANFVNHELLKSKTGGN